MKYIRRLPEFPNYLPRVVDAKALFRFNAELYTPEVKNTIEVLWQETLAELSFGNVGNILESMKQSTR